MHFAFYQKPLLGAYSSVLMQTLRHDYWSPIKTKTESVLMVRCEPIRAQYLAGSGPMRVQTGDPPDGRDIGALSVILRLMGPCRPELPPGGRKPKPGGLGPGKPPRAPRLGGNPREGRGGGPNPRGLVVRPWGALLGSPAGSGVWPDRPFSLCSLCFLSSSWKYFTTLNIYWKIFHNSQWVLPSSCWDVGVPSSPAVSLFPADDYFTIKKTLEWSREKIYIPNMFP